MDTATLNSLTTVVFQGVCLLAGTIFDTIATGARRQHALYMRFSAEGRSPVLNRIDLCHDAPLCYRFPRSWQRLDGGRRSIAVIAPCRPGASAPAR